MKRHKRAEIKKIKKELRKMYPELQTATIKINLTKKTV